MNNNISNHESYHAALYVRLSKDDEKEGVSQSIANQESLLHEFVEKHGVSVFDTYVDDGFSGTSFDRPGFNRMIQDIEDNKVNMVITKDLSRLGRDYIMTGHYMERFFPEHNIRYISLLDGIDTGIVSSSNDITPFRSVMNDMYAKDISKKIKSVKRNKQEQGLFVGWKPTYGYKFHPYTTNKIIIDEESAAVVRRIFAMTLAGASSQDIVDTLNGEQIPTPAVYAGIRAGRISPTTKQWSKRAITQILNNEVYIGNMICRRAEKINYKTKKYAMNPPEKWLVIENAHEPIIDDYTFQAVARILSSRKTTHSSKHQSLLKGMIYCHECGEPMTTINRKKPSGEDCWYFTCRTYYRSTKSSLCTSHAIKEETVTNVVLAQVQKVCFENKKASDLLPAVQQYLEHTKVQDTQDADVHSVEQKLKSITSGMDQMYADKLAGILDPDDFQRFYNKFKLDRERLFQKLEDLKKEKAPSATTIDTAEAIVKNILEDNHYSREVLVSLIERIEFSSQRKLLIKFRYNDPVEISM